MYSRIGNKLVAATCCAVLWLGSSAAFAAPILSVAVNGGSSVSFEDFTVCEGTGTINCVGSGSEGDLVISYFELSADPGAYVAGSFNFYNASSTETLSVLATVLFPMSGTFATSSIAVGTGIASPVGGNLNMTVNGLVDAPSAPLISAAGCAVLADALGGCGASGAGPASLAILTNIGFSLAFDLAPDMQASIGFDPESAYGSGSFFAITQATVPVPAAAWLFLSGLAVLLPARRRLNS